MLLPSRLGQSKLPTDWKSGATQKGRKEVLAALCFRGRGSSGDKTFGVGGVFVEVWITILEKDEVGCHENLYEGLKSDRTPKSVVNIPLH